MTELGRVAALWRYPVKSMAAESLDEVEVSWHGLAGDRRWAFVQEELVRSGFPWLTIRERAEMWRYVPSFAEPDRPDASRTLVRTPAGKELEVADPALATELGERVRLIKQNRGVFDAMPLSLITTASIAAVGAAVGPVHATRRSSARSPASGTRASASTARPSSPGGWPWATPCYERTDSVRRRGARGQCLSHSPDARRRPRTAAAP
jgi:hypothetical protein